MKIVKAAAAAGILCLPLAALSTPAMAASAHNSQAGAMGPTSNDDAPAGMHMRQRQMSGKPMMMKKKKTMKTM